MDPGTAASQITSTLAWPIVVVLVLFALRGDVGHMLRRLRELRFKGDKHEFELQMDSATLEDAARAALPQVTELPSTSKSQHLPLPQGATHSFDGLSVDELAIIALASELTRDVLYVMEDKDELSIGLADGSDLPIPRDSLAEGFPRTAVLVEAIVKHRNPAIGSFTLAVLKAQVERANAHWDQLKDQPHMKNLATMDDLMAMQESDITDQP
jgi:hypothetical protein